MLRQIIRIRSLFQHGNRTIIQLKIKYSLFLHFLSLRQNCIQLSQQLMCFFYCLGIIVDGSVFPDPSCRLLLLKLEACWHLILSISLLSNHPGSSLILPFYIHSPMKRLLAAPIQSPKSKLQIRPSKSKSKLKMKSPAPIQSARPLTQQSSTSRKVKPCFTQQKMRDLLAPVLNSHNTRFELQIGTNWAEAAGNFIVVSSTTGFTEMLIDMGSSYQKCKEWLIISEAVNSQQIQHSFNSLYYPIAFKFFPSLSAAANYLTRPSGEQSQLLFVQRISHIGNGEHSDLICIEDIKDWKSRRLQQNTIYVCQDIEEWGNTIKWKDPSQIPYFITDAQVYTDDGNLRIPFSKQTKVVLFVLKWETNLLKSNLFSLLQKKFKQRILTTTPPTSAFENQKYWGKVLSQFLIPEGHICIFYQHSVDTQIVIDLKKHVDLNTSQPIALLPLGLYQEGLNCYQLKWDSKTRSAHQFTLSSTPNQNAFDNISQFLSAKHRLLTKYKAKLKRLRQVNQLLYTKDQPDHLITDLLSCLGVKVSRVDDLETMFETHKITLLYGYFSFSEVQSVKKYHNVFVVPLCKDYEQGAAIGQISEAQIFLQTLNKVYEQIYEQQQAQSAQSTVHVLYNDQAQISKIMSGLTISEQLLKTQYIRHFKQTLSDFREYSCHIILGEMEDFQEKIDELIRQAQWKVNTLNIQVYLRYGSEFIQRTKDGNFKFIKPSELQKKINEIEEKAIRPEPQKTPEPVINFASDMEIEGVEEKPHEQDAQIYRLYLFIHRSVPYHNLIRGRQKDCHLLQYSKIEQVLIFTRYIKAEEKVTVIANEQSKTLYQQLLRGSGISEGKIRFSYIRDMSETSIRNRIRMILADSQIGDLNQETAAKRFKALAVYDSKSEKIAKSIRVVKKIFGAQLKLLLLKQDQYEEIVESTWDLKISQETQLYVVGGTKVKGKRITSLKSLLILAMHPELKEFDFCQTHIQMPLKNYIGRIIYGGQSKNYSIVAKSRQQKFRETLFARSDRSRHKESVFSRFKTEAFLPERSATPRRRKSSSKPSSLIKLRSDPRYSIIASKSLEEYCGSKLLFHSQQQLYAEIMISQSHSKTTIAVLSEEEFDTFEIFQNPGFQQRNRDIIWVIQTQVSGKSAFSGTNLVFSQLERLSQAVDQLAKDYLTFINFDSLKVVSRGGQIAPKVVLGPGCSNPKNSLLLQVASKQQGRVQILLGNEGKRQSIKFKNVAKANNFLNFVVEGFKGNKTFGINHHFGSLVFCSSELGERVKSAIQKCKKKNVMVKTYDRGNPSSLVGYCLQKILVVLQAESSNFLWKLPFSIAYDESSDKMSELLSITLI